MIAMKTINPIAQAKNWKTTGKSAVENRKDFSAGGRQGISASEHPQKAQSEAHSKLNRPQAEEIYYHQLNYRFWRTQFPQWEIKPENVDKVHQLAEECEHLRAQLLAGVNLIKELTNDKPLTSKQKAQKAQFFGAMNYLSPKLKDLARRAREADIQGESTQSNAQASE